MNIDIDSLVQQILVFCTSYGLQIIGALVILLVGRIAAGLARGSVRKLLRARHIDRSIVSFASSMVYFLVLTVTVLAALSKFGIQTTSFIAVLGAAGFAVGLALQGSLSNFAAGVLILLFRPFRVGDVIRAAGVEGEVKEIHIFVTELATPDNIKLIVPNSAIMAGNIANVSGYSTRCVDVQLSIGHHNSIEKATETALQVMRADSRVLDKPAPQLLVVSLREASVGLSARMWVASPDYGGVLFDMNRKLKEAFDAAGFVPASAPRMIMVEETN